MSGEKWNHQQVSKGTNYTYDDEGNLTAKKKPNGEAWQYEYYGNGMLSKVILPDESEVSFKYDPLGRRTEKRTNEKTTKFVWDGNNPIHEWVENGETKSEKRNGLVTWIFDDGFVPTAKLTKDSNYSIISDYMGTPVEAYDSSGKKVWEQELDIYGKVIRRTGDVDFIPFRYQGQYDDIETGLYYNRFRYYDPDMGQYTQPDPIGLEGGNPTLYSYVSNPNWWIDPLGMERGVGNGVSSGGTTRVGRWMSRSEYNEMLRTGRVQASPDGNTTYVANPANPTAYRAAPSGSVYVEFDVPTSSIRAAGNIYWGQISGPGSLADRLLRRQGLPPITEMPLATNIRVVGVD